MDQKLAKRIGRAVRDARAALDFSQADAAEALGISTEFYGRLERGVALPSVPTLVRLAEVLGVSADVLLGLQELGKRRPTATAEQEVRTSDRVLTRRLRRASPSALRLVRLLLGELEKAEGRSRR